MGFAINTNNDALNTYRNLTNVQSSLSKSLERLSSGLRINQAGDDAAGLTIATKIGSQVSSLQQASRNAQDGASLVQTADGALSQAQSLLQRLRDLAVQASNDSNSGTARSAITTEATSITDELRRLGNATDFNGLKLNNGSQTVLKFQVGANNDGASQVEVNLSGANLVNVANTLATGGSGTPYAVGDLSASMKFTSTVGSAATTVTVSGLGAYASASDAVAGLNATSDFASKFTASTNTSGSTTKVQVTAKDGGVVSGQNSTVSGSTTTYADITATAVSTANAISFADAASARASIDAIDTQIGNISTARANIGALESRFSNAVSAISTSVQNLTAAKSRITDVDMAQEMVNYTRANVLSQSGTAMLAQANSLPQLALKLLG